MGEQYGWTQPDPIYPPYFNVTIDGDVVKLTVREAPEIFDGQYVCGFSRDRGRHGRCTPGDDRCNNYCNMAPEKGPMQDHPGRCVQHRCGKTACMTMPLAEFKQLIANFNG